MKDYYSLLFVVIFALLLINPNTPEVQARKIDIKEAEGFVAFIMNSEVSTSNNVNECNCNGTKELTHGDGHKTPCPCDNCTCEVSTTEQAEPVKKNHSLDNFYLVKWTAAWCGPCQEWSAKEKAKLEAAGLAITEIDYDSNKNLAKKYGVSSLPSFHICNKQNQTFYSNGFIQGYLSSESILKKIETINEQ